MLVGVVVVVVLMAPPRRRRPPSVVMPIPLAAFPPCRASSSSRQRPVPTTRPSGKAGVSRRGVVYLALGCGLKSYKQNEHHHLGRQMVRRNAPTYNKKQQQSLTVARVVTVNAKRAVCTRTGRSPTVSPTTALAAIILATCEKAAVD
jgi:hypothetical protein